jgi:hypothetical protein
MYSLRPKIHASLGPNTQTNVWCKFTKLPFVFSGKHLNIGLSFVRESFGNSCLL